MIVLENIRKKAKKNPKKIVFPEALDERILKASESILEQGIAKIILLGNPKNILRKIDELKLNLKGVEIIDHLKSEKFNLYAEKLFELRKHKGISLDDAKKMLKDELYFGTMMLNEGHADGLINGALHPTLDVLKAAFNIIKPRKNIKKVSGAFFIVKKDMNLLFADCAVMPNPNSEELAEISLLSAETYKMLVGEKARVAMLSYSTMGDGNGIDIKRMREAVKIAKIKGVNVVGEIQADAALVGEIFKRKCPNIKFEGNRNVLIFPDLDAGNISYKLVERICNIKAIGPILQGLSKPLNDLSRGCSVQDIVDLTAITVLQAQNLRD